MKVAWAVIILILAEGKPWLLTLSDGPPATAQYHHQFVKAFGALFPQGWFNPRNHWTYLLLYLQINSVGFSLGRVWIPKELQWDVGGIALNSY